MSQENKSQPKKQQKQLIMKQEQKQKIPEDIDNLLNQFQAQGNLNLTNQQDKQQEQDAEQMKKIKQQYEKFMKQLGQEAGEGDAGIGNLGKAFQELLKGLPEDEDQTGEKIGKKFTDMFENFSDPSKFENAATQLLNEFMDKSLLEQPLKQTNQNYIKYFNDMKKQNKQIPQQHLKQHETVKQLLQVIQKQPSNKNKMINLFSQLQAQGNPPASVAPSFGFF